MQLDDLTALELRLDRILKVDDIFENPCQGCGTPTTFVDQEGAPSCSPDCRAKKLNYRIANKNYQRHYFCIDY